MAAVEWNITALPSGPLQVALPPRTANLNGGSTNQTWTVLGGFLAEPVDDTDGSTGMWEVGEGSVYAPFSVKVFPYANAFPGQQFSMRVWGLDTVGTEKPVGLWCQYLLAEFLCTVGSIPTVLTGGLPKRVLSENDRLCDDIQLVQGLAASQVDVLTCGPGSGLAARVRLPLDGVKKIQFDFQTVDNAAITMNALMTK